VLGVVSSDYFIAGVVLGVPIVVGVVVVLASGGKLRGPALAAVTAVAVVIVAVIAFGVYRTTPETTAAASAGSGGSGPVLPPVVSPTGPPPSGPAPSPSVTATAPTPSAPCSPSGKALQETAKNIAFSQDCLAAPGGVSFTITFDNQDAGIPHNIHIFDKDPTQDPNAKSLFMGQLVTGPTTTTYQVPALLGGTYYFHCDVHPTQMNGTFVVK